MKATPGRMYGIRIKNPELARVIKKIAREKHIPFSHAVRKAMKFYAASLNYKV